MSQSREHRPVALVTGARQGIGRGIALELARAGFRIVANDRVADRAMEETLADIEQEEGAAKAVIGDISIVEGLDRLVESAWDCFGTIDCLVSNAGVSGCGQTDLLALTPDDYDRVTRVNSRGTFFLTQHVARRMVEAPVPAGYRCIIFISSANARQVSVNWADYCLSKSCLPMMAQLFATRLAPHAIGVHEVRPGLIRTEMTAPGRDAFDALIAGGVAPFRRWGTPRDVGVGVASLAAGAFPFSTGGVFDIDGGLHVNRLS